MDINQACDAFRKILEEQQARIANMNTEKTDFSTKQVVTIGVVDHLNHFSGPCSICKGDTTAV